MTTFTYLDPFTDERLEDLLARNEALADDDDSWTWLDNDPDVAWYVDPEDEPCYHGRLRQILEDAGWESCYHDRRSVLHYNVKLNGNGAYQGFRDKIRDIHPDAQDRVEERADSLRDWDLRDWWEDLADYLRYDLQVTTGKAWSCGRSGGYLNVDRSILSDGDSMLRLTQYVARAHAYFNSREYGEDLAERAIEQDQETQMMYLASPRPDRIEA